MTEAKAKAEAEAGAEAGAKAAAFPQDRSCPYHPPVGYRQFRDARPITRTTLFDGRPVWLVTGHPEARALLADGRLSTDVENEAFPVPTPLFRDVSRRRTPLLGVDDPEHNAQRRMLIPAFSLKRAGAMRPRIQATVDRLIDGMVARGDRAELVGAFALPVPSSVICELLGVPYDDHDLFEEQSRRMLRGPRAADVEDAREGLLSYLRDLIDAKRARPGDGLLDELVGEHLAAGRLSVEEIARFGLILLVAGHETTSNMISLGVFTLLRHPEQLAQLRADPALLPAAVEELMRFLSIADGMLRVAVDDIDVAGTVIRKDDGVIFPTSLINRDDTVYAHPDTLDWHRPARHHVAFGFGIHQCLGQNLARAELEIALGTLFRRLPGLRLAAPAERIPFKPGDTIQGMLELPVAW
ncbi:cytochrome P450 [Streptomyces sp. NPDC089799]|uniref:cytochrome P450 n=1 Tax=Streptomyces sp. NPDC089799 TaxID=3155066 RepID=UPI00342DF000